jgi:hypothetical protein
MAVAYSIWTRLSGGAQMRSQSSRMRGGQRLMSYHYVQETGRFSQRAHSRYAEITTGPEP